MALIPRFQLGHADEAMLSFMWATDLDPKASANVIKVRWLKVFFFFVAEEPRARHLHSCAPFGHMVGGRRAGGG